MAVCCCGRLQPSFFFYPLEFNHSIIILLMSDETLSPVLFASVLSRSKCSFDKKVETLFSFCLGFAICSISFTFTIIAHNTYMSSAFYCLFILIKYLFYFSSIHSLPESIVSPYLLTNCGLSYKRCKSLYILFTVSFCASVIESGIHSIKVLTGALV